MVNTFLKLRHELGILKYKVFDDFAYRIPSRRSLEFRESVKGKIFSLPRVLNDGDPSVEIHMLCGKAQLDMGIAASWSLMRFITDSILIVHSDGTLDEDDARQWKQVIKNVIFISKEERDAVINKKISSVYPNVYKWRLKNWASAKLVDFHLFGTGRKLLLLDSDVLCFNDPVEIKNAITKNEFLYRWNSDVSSSYFASGKIMKSITGLKIPEKFNSGLFLCSRFSADDFEFLDSVIEKFDNDPRVDINHFWAEQSFYAVCAARFEKSHSFPEEYSVVKGKTRKDAVTRHYVGVPSVRFRYFIEGLRIILKQSL